MKQVEIKEDKKEIEKYCSNCKKKITGEPNRVTDENVTLDLCNECYNKIQDDINKTTKDINYLMAVFLGIVFGILGAFLWFIVVVLTKYQLGIVAIGVGFLVGYGVSIGAGKKKSLSLQIISMILAFISIIIGEYLILNHYSRQYLLEQGYKLSGYFLNPIIIIKDVFLNIKQDPLTLLFWGIAIYFAYAFIKPLKIRKIR
jgi:hypothetical protein